MLDPGKAALPLLFVWPGFVKYLCGRAPFRHSGVEGGNWRITPIVVGTAGIAEWMVFLSGRETTSPAGSFCYAMMLENVSIKAFIASRTFL